MGIISTLTTREPIPGDPEHSIEVRALRRSERRAAQEARTHKVFANIRTMGVDLLKEFQSLAADQEKATEVEAADQDPTNAYDQDAVLRAGVVGWSYEGDVDIDVLDEETADWAFRTILRLSGVRVEGSRLDPTKPSTGS